MKKLTRPTLCLHCSDVHSNSSTLNSWYHYIRHLLEHTWNSQALYSTLINPSTLKWLTKQLPGLKNLSYPERLRKLKLPTLTFRRIRGDMIELCKILSGKYDKEAAPFVKLWKDMTSRRGVRGNSVKIFPQRARREIRKNSFALIIVKTWNCLPDSVITAPTTNTFKNKLDKYWANQDILYDDHRSTINGMGNEIEVGSWNSSRT